MTMGQIFLILLCNLLLLCSGSGTTSNRRTGSNSRNNNANFDDSPFDSTDFDAEYEDVLSRRRITNLRNNSPVNSNRRNSGCPKEFDNRCKCGIRIVDKHYSNPGKYAKPQYFVECVNSGFTNTSMLEHLPDETEVLIFQGNKIETLNANVFGRSTNYNLKIIDLSENGIKTIDGKAFHHVDSVEILLLAHNELSNASLHAHPRVFSNFYSLKELYLTNTFNNENWSLSDLRQVFIESNLTQLEKLHLGLNEMEVISNRSAFCELPSLRELYIPQNHLTDDVDIDTTCLNNLEVIDLRENRIRTLSSYSKMWPLLDVKNKKGENIRIELLKNPFICDCQLKEFIVWLRNASRVNTDMVRDNEDLVCEDGMPVSNVKKHVREITETECVPIKLSNPSSSAVVTGVIWIISLIFVTMFLMVMYSYRSSIFRNVRPLLQSTTHGVKYTSIDKNEECEIAHV